VRIGFATSTGGLGPGPECPLVIPRAAFRDVVEARIHTSGSADHGDAAGAACVLARAFVAWSDSRFRDLCASARGRQCRSPSSPRRRRMTIGVTPAPRWATARAASPAPPRPRHQRYGCLLSAGGGFLALPAHVARRRSSAAERFAQGSSMTRILSIVENRASGPKRHGRSQIERHDRVAALQVASGNSADQTDHIVASWTRRLLLAIARGSGRETAHPANGTGVLWVSGWGSLVTRAPHPVSSTGNDYPFRPAHHPRR
jgi:hypothetical protein